MAGNLLAATFLAFLGCTLASPAIDVRIAGGFEAFPNQFPYQVAIYSFVPGQRIPLQDDFCSGSLISQNYVLTAASCLARSQGVLVVIGSQNLEVHDSDIVKISSSKFIIPEGYVSGSYEWDVALIKLSRPVELSDKIKTVQLAEVSKDYAGDVATVAGWGATYAAQFTVEPVLRWIESAILSYSQCVKDNQWFQEVFFEEVHICQYAVTNSACRGDAGAPLTVDGVQIGLVAYTPGNCFRGYPVVHTRVAKYIDWIKEHSDL